MLRIVNMEDATDTKGSFAVWNTVEDQFYHDNLDDQVWDSLEDFKAGCSDPRTVERVRSLRSENK